MFSSVRWEITCNEELYDRFREFKLEFYHEEKTPVSFWVRLTLPFALILMLIGLPLNYLIIGEWGYKTKKTFLYNWFKSLGLL